MNLNFMSPINKLSYGYAGWNICKELIKQGIDVTIFPLNNVNTNDIDNPLDFNLIKQYHHRVKIFDNEAPAIKLYHQFDLDTFPNTSGERIGFPIFELDDFTQREKAHLKSCNSLFVCSRWAKKVLYKIFDNEISKFYDINIVPLGVDPSIFFSYAGTGLDKPRETNKCIFLTIGKIEIRKLVDLLPDIFAKAFTQSDNVELWVSFDTSFVPDSEKQEWINFYKSSPLGNKIKIIPRVSTLTEIAQLINQADFLIQLSRCEGFSLPSLEGLACGKYVLAGDYGGQTEFLNETNSYLVHIDEWETAWDGRFFINKIGRWASFKEPQIEQAVEHLRTMYKRKMYDNDIINWNGIENAKQFTWENSAKKIIEVIQND